MLIAENDDIQVHADPTTGGVTQVVLYGQPLLMEGDGAWTELAVNDRPVQVRSAAAERQREMAAAGLDVKVSPDELSSPHDPGAMHADHFVNHYCGWGLDVTRHLRVQTHTQRLFMYYQLRRRPTLPTCPCPGPGEPAIEARMFVDTFTVARWPWRFWGEDTRMLHLSLHSTGPDGPEGHIGYTRGTVEHVKGMMRNIWRRQYPGVMAVHGAVFYDEKSEAWLAFTCRLPQRGYYLDLEQAGEGLAYSFTLHAEMAPEQSLTLPEIVLHYGRRRDEMEQFVKDYTTWRWQPMPPWQLHTTWTTLCLWDQHRDWRSFWQQAARLVDTGACTGIGPYCMIHHWARSMGGTSPLGYEPDPAMGPQRDFEAGALALKKRGIPLGVWLSHSGLMHGRDIDEDWFVRGVNGQWSASWGNRRGPALVLINPGHPGYIAYTKKWLKYYNDLGFRWFFFDCAGWAMSPDYTPRDFMEYPGDCGLMSVRFYEEIAAYLAEIDPGAIISGEGFSSDFPGHVASIHSNPVHSPDGLGPRDYVLGWNRLPGQRLVVDQAGALVPGSGVCTLPLRKQEGRSFDACIEATATDPMYQAITACVRERGMDGARHLPGDFSILDDRLFFPAKYDGRPLQLPEEYAACKGLCHAVTGEVIERAADGSFTAPEPGMYAMQ